MLGVGGQVPDLVDPDCRGWLLTALGLADLANACGAAAKVPTRAATTASELAMRAGRVREHDGPT